MSNVRPHMREPRLLLAAFGAFGFVAYAQVPVYAIYGIKNVSQQSSVTSVNVGVIPSGNMSECQRQIEVYEGGMRRRGLPPQIELVPSKCTSALSPEFQTMVRGGRVKDAYIVQTSNRSWAPVFTAWYNVPRSDPEATCKKLVDGMRATLPEARADLSCLPPL